MGVEYHRNTLTDTREAAARLFRAVDHPNLTAYWQQHPERDLVDRRADLESILPWLSNVHVFERSFIGSTDVCRLAMGRDSWVAYLATIATTGRDHDVLIEFVQDSRPAAFEEDAKVLLEVVGAAGQ